MYYYLLLYSFFPVKGFSTTAILPPKKRKYRAKNRYFRKVFEPKNPMIYWLSGKSGKQ
jgi:hypothetical protein